MNLQRLPSHLCQAGDAKSCLKTVICLCRKLLQFPLFEEHAFTIKCPCPSCSQENTRKAEKKGRSLELPTVSVYWFIKT